MSNVLDIKLPRKRIRLAFSLSLTLGLLVFMSAFGLVGVGGLLLLMRRIFFRFVNEQELLSDDWPGLLLFPIITCAFYVLAIGLFSRIAPGRVQIIAVEIMEKHRGHLGTFYWFKGASISRIIRLVPFISPSVSLGLSRLSSQRLNGSRFYKNSHNILYLDEEKNIAIAAEKCWGGGAVLLDENLTHLKLNKEGKKRILTSIRAQQEFLTKDPEYLGKIIKAIADRHRSFTFSWDEKRQKYKKI